MKRSFAVRWICLVFAILLAFSMTGCDTPAEPSEVPSHGPSDEMTTEPLVRDFREKPASEAEFVDSHPVGTTVRYDLNGDGIGEDITVRTHEFEAGQLTIGDAACEILSCSPTGYFTVVNVDDSADRLLVGISDYGPSDDPETVFYAYDGKNIREIGYLRDILGQNVYGNGGAVCHGDGTITAGSRWDVLGTWNTVGLYRVTDRVEDITEFYPFIDWEGNPGTWEVTARHDIIMYEEEMIEPTTVVPGGSTMKMVGLHRDAEDHLFWVLFEVPDLGKNLWLRTERIEWASYLQTDVGFISSQEAFEGFFYAG